MVSSKPTWPSTSPTATANNGIDPAAISICERMKDLARPQVLSQGREPGALLGFRRRDISVSIQICANNIFLRRTKHPPARTIEDFRRSGCNITCIYATRPVSAIRRKVISGFHASSKALIEKASSNRRFCTRFATTQICERISEPSIRRLIRNLCGI